MARTKTKTELLQVLIAQSGFSDRLSVYFEGNFYITERLRNGSVSTAFLGRNYRQARESLKRYIATL